MFIRTERLFLRPGWVEDAPELARAIAHEPVVRMLARAPGPTAKRRRAPSSNRRSTRTCPACW